MRILPAHKTVRYTLDKSVTRYIWLDPEFKERVELPNSWNAEVFVNILEQDDSKIKVKLFYQDGQVFEGWYLKCLNNFKIYNYEQLFDGRFNQ